MEEPEKKKKPAKKKATPRTSAKTTRKKTTADKADDETTAATEPPAKKKTTRATGRKTSQKAPTKQDEAPQSVAETQETDGENKESELMVNGLKFFSQLAQTLGDKEATARLVSSITEHDKKTGKTYLKVPVENEKTVEDAIMMLGTLFKALQ